MKGRAKVRFDCLYSGGHAQHNITFLQKISFLTVHSVSSNLKFSKPISPAFIYLVVRSKDVMVCQAASQTRFRALKHESGIKGEPAIIVRVIACFQPLHDCQAEYFRHLLKPVT
ncbi:hypothetical protein D0Y65_040070 [Glycine soja]|nr:hypothetical protein D0Y65_040070 [Glycine soja]